MSGAAKLLLVEPVILPGNDPQPGKLLDVTMMTCLSSRERTAAEWEGLLQDAGFMLQSIAPTRAAVSILEATPALPLHRDCDDRRREPHR